MGLVIGLTGGIATGKTLVAELFKEKGIDIIDTDQLARDVVKPGQAALNEIVEHFGEAILSNGTLDRQKLRQIIFNNAGEKQWLEACLHPRIRTLTDERIRASTSPYCIVVIPLLFETDPNPLINRILVVDADPEVQIARVMARDHVDEAHAKSIIEQQASREHKLQHADDVIHNHRDKADLESQVNTLHQHYGDGGRL